MGSDDENVDDEKHESVAALMYTIMQPTRQKIIQLLKSSKEPLYIEQIARRINEDRRSVSFHLATLAEYELVTGDYREIVPARGGSHPARGKAAKFYTLTPKLDQVIRRLDALLSSQV